MIVYKQICRLAAFLIVTTTTSFLSRPCNGQQETATTAASNLDRPNIVLILADDLGIHDLGCYGRADHRTPHLDQMAASALRFTSAYTAQPICSPSRAALMTGKFPARLHLTNFLPGRADAASQKLMQPRIEPQLPLEEITIAELLRDAGYATGLFGKWHLGSGKHSPQAQGFQKVVSPPANTMAGEVEGGKGEFAITEAAEQFIQENRNQPFFCYIAHNNPHIPLQEDANRIAANKDAFHPTYAAMIETLDRSIGRLLTRLDELKLTDNTIVLFTSDNGGLHVLEFPGTPATHNGLYRAGKGYLYEGGIREPLLVRWPARIKQAAVCDVPVQLTDLVPTLLLAAGVNPSKTVGPLDGVNLLPLLEGKEIPERTLFWHFPNYTNQGGRPASALREGDWKLIENLEDNSIELYNLAADPAEQNNLIGSESERAGKLKEKLDKWRTSVGAQMPTPNPQFDPSLHRAMYIDQDPSKLLPAKTAAEVEPLWKEWRQKMNDAVKGKKPQLKVGQGSVQLFAKDAKLHSETMRYEPESYKNVLGYWVKVDDWAEWEFNAPAAGDYEIEIQQGCGTGSGNAKVLVEVADQKLEFTVLETGHFQNMILRTIGVVQLKEGMNRIAIKPQTKPGVAVMDLRQITLRPIRNE